MIPHVCSYLRHTGTCCPTTTGHVRIFEEARKMLLDDPTRAPSAAPRPPALEVFQHCIGLLSLNSDGHVKKKLKSKGLQGLSKQ